MYVRAEKEGHQEDESSGNCIIWGTDDGTVTILEHSLIFEPKSDSELDGHINSPPPLS